MRWFRWQWGITIALLLILSSLDLPSTAAPTSPSDQLKQGTQEYAAGQVKAAITAWQQARTAFQRAKNPQGEATALADLGMAYVTAERHREAVEALEAFLPLARSFNQPLLEAQALGNLGIAYKELGFYSQSIATHRQAGKQMRALGDRSGLGQVLLNLGSAFEAVGDYDNALIAFQQSFKITQENRDRRGQGIALGNLGTIYANQGKDPDAIAAFEQSLAIAREVEHVPGQASALLNLGSVYQSQRQLERAQQAYQESLKLAQTIGDRHLAAQAFGALGLVDEDQKNFSQAVQSLRKSVEIARSLNNPEAQGTALNNLGHVLLSAGRLTEAETVLRAAVQLLDALRPGLSDVYKVSIFDTQTHTYNLLQQVLIAAHKPEAALEAAEWGRARAFAERLAKRVRGTGKKAAETAIAPIRIDQIRRIAREQRATLVEYAIVPDDDFKFRGKQQPKAATLLIWVVQPTGKVKFRQLDIRDLWQQNLPLAELVSVARSCLAPGKNCEQVAAKTPAAPALTLRHRRNPALHRLHQLLIQPIADLLPTDPDTSVIFIPVESLFLVPFPALQAADGTYLIEQHTLLTAPAIQVLALTQQLQQQAKRTTSASSRFERSSALVVGNPTMPTLDAEPLSPLPAAEMEAHQIAELLNTKALVGKDATHRTVVRQMTQAKVVHLATHGLLEYGHALGETDIPGAIALAPDPFSTAIANGFLTSNQIFDLRMQANLVVLSACDTGRGRITGDGVIGLSRAFISAGVSSVVVSLWAVSDDSTSKLMVNFHRNLLQQPNKAKALRYAMLKTMQQYAQPIEWAAFTLIGAAE